MKIIIMIMIINDVNDNMKLKIICIINDNEKVLINDNNNIKWNEIMNKW